MKRSKFSEEQIAYALRQVERLPRQRMSAATLGASSQAAGRCVGIRLQSATMNRLYYGDNQDVLRRHIDDQSVDLVYLDPPFKPEL
jgi:16S rRNA G966 N2-methylase RsmD